MLYSKNSGYNLLCLPILVLALVITVFSAQATTTLEKLVEVNSYWENHSMEAPDHVPSGLTEYEWIALHLQLVEKTLRNRDISHLTVEQLQSRLTLLDRLNDYWRTGAFPINTTHDYRLPIFIDPFDNFCAVGYLIKESGNEDISRMISHQTNFAYLAEMNYPELNNWIVSSGFTFEELAWIQPGYPPATTIVDMNGGTTGTVYTITSDTVTNAVYVGGEFSSAGGVAGTANVAMWNGSQWFPLGNGLTGKVEALQLFNGELYAGGFDLLPTGSIHSIAIWNGTIWYSHGPVFAHIKAFAVYQGELYAGGTSSSVNGDAVLSRWDGTSWIPVPINSPGVINSLHVFEGKLIIGGSFTSTDAPSSPNIISYDGTNISGLGSGVPAEVFAITEFRDSLFAGGSFFNAQGDTFGLAKFSSNNWKTILPLNEFSTWSGGNPNSRKITSLAVKSTNNLIVAGYFIYNGMTGNARNAIKMAEGPSYFSFSGEGIFNESVYALHMLKNRFYYGGAFSNNQNIPVSRIGYAINKCGTIFRNEIVCSHYTSPSGKFTWTTSGTYDDFILTSSNCDSVFRINLTINNTTKTFSSSVCGSYTSPSGKYTWTTSGIYSDTIPNTKGCDSIITIYLNIINITKHEFQTACNSFTWIDGNTYTSSINSATFTIPGSSGCDTVVNLNLTISNTTSNTINKISCSSFTSPSGNHTWTSSGTYTDVIPNSKGCDSIITFNLTINSVDASVTENASTLTANAPDAQYQWMNCDSWTFTGETGQTFTPSSAGDYAVVVTKNNCAATSECISVTDVGIRNNLSSSFKLTPNPTEGNLVVDFGKVMKEATIILLNVHGQVISSSKIHSTDRIEMKIEGSAGIYFLQIRSDEGENTNFKVLKQ